MFSLSTLAVLAASSVLPRVAAHGGVLSYSWSGQWYWGWQPYDTPAGQTSLQRPWSTYNPILDATDPTIACNDDGTSGALQLTATVSAGTAVTAYWNQVWPHAIGPMLTYLALCPGSTCTGVNAATLDWFKIDESGLLSGTQGGGSWADGKMIADNSTWTTTIPASVPSGNYLLRFETIALHSLPAQFYAECAQVNIINGGSRAPTAAETCKFPGCYSNTDPGLDLDVYSQNAQVATNYTIPGPPLYNSGASTGPTSVKSTSSSTTTSKSSSTTSKSSTSTTSTTTSKSSSSSSHSSSSTSSSVKPVTTGAAEYAQCGGQGWTGATTCVSPYVCKQLNPYYFQCLPQ